MSYYILTNPSQFFNTVDTQRLISFKDNLCFVLFTQIQQLEHPVKLCLYIFVYFLTRNLIFPLTSSFLWSRFTKCGFIAKLEHFQFISAIAGCSTCQKHWSVPAHAAGVFSAPALLSLWVWKVFLNEAVWLWRMSLTGFCWCFCH